MKDNKKIVSQPEILNKMLYSLQQASGGCSQLVHLMGGDIRFVVLRDTIDLTKEGVLELATQQITTLTGMKH